MAHSTTNVTYTAGLSHYPVMAALGIAVPLIAGVLTVGEGSPGSRLVLASLFITVAWMGVESVVYPHRQGSFGTTWGWLAAGWAVVLLALGLRRATQPAFDGVRARPTRSGRSAA